jgi:uncharacterized glyoxalase superfamily protein PhnB
MQSYVDANEQLVTELVVSDARCSVEFYRSIGFELLRDEGDFAELSWDGHRMFILAAPPTRSAHSSTGHPEVPTVNVRVMVPDVDEHWRRAVALGLSVASPIADRYYGLRDFTVLDPDGFGIRFASFLTTKAE